MAAVALMERAGGFAGTRGRAADTTLDGTDTWAAPAWEVAPGLGSGPGGAAIDPMLYDEDDDDDEADLDDEDVFADDDDLGGGEDFEEDDDEDLLEGEDGDAAEGDKDAEEDDDEDF
jgi:hypothetical protein